MLYAPRLPNIVNIIKLGDYDGVDMQLGWVTGNAYEKLMEKLIRKDPRGRLRRK
jgi:hypothetical protein